MNPQTIWKCGHKWFGLAMGGSDSVGDPVAVAGMMVTTAVEEAVACW